jgi:hypothetical protein
MTPLAADIYGRIDRRLFALTCLGIDVLGSHMAQSLLTVSDQLAAQLVGCDPNEAAQTAIDLADMVDLDDPQDAASPLGIAVALTFEGVAITQAHAARLLGCSRQRVSALRAEGKLTGPDSSHVWRHVVAQRMADLIGPERPVRAWLAVRIADRVTQRIAPVELDTVLADLLADAGNGYGVGADRDPDQYPDEFDGEGRWTGAGGADDELFIDYEH